MTDKASSCPICGKPSVARFKPFCSARCSMVDLGQWLGEGYKIEVRPDAEDDERTVAPPEGEENT